MFDKFRELETRLVKSGDWVTICAGRRNTRMANWTSNGLVAFLVGLGTTIISSQTAIRQSSVFRRRYRIPIGQNFERRRREPLMKIPYDFYYLPFNGFTTIVSTIPY